MGAAAEHAAENLDKDYAKMLQQRKLLEKMTLPETETICADVPRLCNTVCFHIEGTEAKVLRLMLHSLDISVSYGMEDDCISFSLSRDTTKKEIEKAMEETISCTENLRKLLSA